MENPSQPAPLFSPPLQAWRQTNPLEHCQTRRVSATATAGPYPPSQRRQGLAARSPSLEIGAGTGYWAALLHRRGARVTALDRNPVETGNNRYHRCRGAQTPVGSWFPAGAAPQPEAPRFDAEWRHHTLFLCGPPYADPMAGQFLQRFQGENPVYAGEAENGCTGDNRFHQEL